MNLEMCILMHLHMAKAKPKNRKDDFIRDLSLKPIFAFALFFPKLRHINHPQFDA